jgi:predicted amidohydrolase YtcJ
VPLLFGIVFAIHGTAQQPATSLTLYRNGHIYTNDPSSPWAQAILVRGEEILAVGDEDEVAALADKGAQIVDLEKHFVMPGFNDAHVHIGGAGEDWVAVRLNGVQNVGELQKRLSEGVAQHKEGEWITGSGWDHTFWPEKKFPNRQQLDAVSPKNPVMLTHISGHVAVANSLALQLAGISKSTKSPAGGEIEKDEKGEPTGMLKEGAAMGLVWTKIPPASGEHRRRGIELALADLVNTASPPRKTIPRGKISSRIERSRMTASSPFESQNGCRFSPRSLSWNKSAAKEAPPTPGCALGR